MAEGLQRNVVYLGLPIAPSSMSPNAGGGGSCGVSPMSTAVHKIKPNKLWRSNSIFKAVLSYVFAISCVNVHSIFYIFFSCIFQILLDPPTENLFLFTL
jgi:hypothetical protein